MSLSDPFPLGYAPTVCVTQQEDITVKKKLFILLPVLLITVLCVLALPSCGGYREYRRGAYRYTVENGEATITEYIGSDADVTVPDTIGGKPVVAIGTDAFADQLTLKSVTLPDSVTRIEFGAFFRCGALESVTLGEGIREIDALVFSHCDKLTYNEYENGSYLGSPENPYLALVRMSPMVETAVFHPDTRVICGEAFKDCDKLKDLIIPEGILSIGGFALPSLKTVSFPATMEHIDGLAFSDCRTPSEITVAEGNTAYKSVDGNLFSYDGTRLIKYAGGKENQTYTVPDGTVIIEGNAFEYAKHLTEVTLPDSVEEIGDHAFLYCEGLKTLSLGKGLRIIGGQAFGFCKSLTEVTIPDHVEELSYSVFSECEKLETVVIGSGVTWLGDTMFMGCDALREVVFKDPDGWKAGTMYTIFPKRMDLSDPEQNVKYLRDEFDFYQWKKDPKE